MTYRHAYNGRRAELRGNNVRLLEHDALLAAAAYPRPVDAQAVARGWIEEGRPLDNAIQMRAPRSLSIPIGDNKIHRIDGGAK
jgi:hypothetical protein